MAVFNMNYSQGGDIPLSPPMNPDEVSAENALFVNALRTNDNASCAPSTYTDDGNAYPLFYNESALLDPVFDNAVDPAIYLNIKKPDVQLQAPANDHLVFTNNSNTVVIPPVNGGLAFPASQRLLGYERQTSLNIALEVLGTCQNEEVQNNASFTDLYPPTPSPSVNGDDLYLSHPSPAFSHYGVPSNAPVRCRTVSDVTSGFFVSAAEEDSRTRAFSADCTGYGHDVQNFIHTLANSQSTETGTTPTDNTNTTANDSSTNGEYSSKPAASLEPFQAYLTNAPTVEDVAEGSLDVYGMIDDVIATTEPLKTEPMEDSEVTVSHTDSVDADHSYAAQFSSVNVQEIILKEEQKQTIPPPQATVIDLTEEEPCSSKSVDISSSSASPTIMQRSSSYKRKRTRNNAACRESRKKRKVQRDEMEDKAEYLQADNEEMRKKIVELEEEVKKTREELLFRMTRGRAK
ncbi:uncharacterized protein LOC143470492 [Clavelina lepadiformis]|uniref:uncharacterized protein LOC143470492 n=1 Tax=Clavelina lepadiformis TaxID=159417 RepID=UPI0040423030